MVRATARFCLVTVFRLALFIIALGGLVVARLAAGPIQIDALAPTIESRLNAALPGWRVDIGGVVLAWRRDRGDIGFTMQEVALTDAEGVEVAEAREAIVKFDIVSGFRGVAAPTELSLTGADALLLRTPDGLFRFALTNRPPVAAPELDETPSEGAPDPDAGVAQDSAAAAPGAPAQADDNAFSAVAAIVEGLSGDRGALESLSQFERLEVREFTLRYIDEMSGARWRAPGAALIVERGADGLAAAFSAAVETGEDHPPMAMALRGERRAGERTVDLLATFANATGAAIAQQVPALEAFRALEGYASGSAEARVDLDSGDLMAFDASLSTADAEIVLGPNQRLPVRSFAIDMAFDPAAARFTLSKLDFSIDDVVGTAEGEATLAEDANGDVASAVGALRFDRLRIARDGVFDPPMELSKTSVSFAVDADAIRIGRLSFTTPHATFAGDAFVELAGDAPMTRASISFSRFPATHLIDHWPLHAAPGGRKWIEQNIKGGWIEGGSLFWRSKGDDEEFRGAFTFTDLEGVAVEGMTPITKGVGSGVATLDGFRLDIDEAEVDLGEAGALDLAGSSFEILEFAPPGEPDPAVVDLRAAGPLRAALTLIDQPPLGLLSRLGKTPQDASGDANITARLALPLAKDLKTEQVEAEVSADLANLRVAAPEIDSTVTARKAELTVGTDKLQLWGSMGVDGTPVWVRWTEVFSPGRNAARSIFDIRFRPDAERLWSLGAPKDIAPSGRADLRGRFSVFDKGPVTFAGEVDLEELALALPNLGWRKGAGAPGKVEIKATLGADAIEIELPQASVGDLHFKGRITADGEGALRRFEASPLVIGDGTEVNVALSRKDGGWLAVIRGAKLDLRPVIQAGGPETAPAQQFSEAGSGATAPFEVDLRIDRARLSQKVYLHEAVALARVAPDGAVVADASGKIGGRAEISASYQEPGDSRGRFAVAADDAGGLLRELEFFDDGYGGALALTGALEPGGVARGELGIENIVVRDAPELAQILSYATLIGLVDSLASGGITFTKVHAPFELTPARLTISEAAATGPAMGIALDGRVNQVSGDLKLDGAVSPAYGVSSLVKNIPLLGEFITGGEGEGIVGASFKVRGNVDDPEITVNPLSVLAIGPFRRLFSPGAGDGGAPLPRAPRTER